MPGCSSRCGSPGASRLGFGYDLAVALWWCLPLVLLGWFWPALRARRALGVVALLRARRCCRLIFVSVPVFWNEFASRFNFIAVDHLVYTREVVGHPRVLRTGRCSPA